MEPVAAQPRPTLVTALTVGGGVLVLVSGFLAWFELTGQTGSVDLKGTDLTMGLGAILMAIIAVLCGIMIWVRAPKTGGKAWAVTAIVLGAILTFIGGNASLAPESALTSFEANAVAEQFGVSEAVAEAALEQAFASGSLSAKASVGAYVALLGGLLTLAGGILGVRFAKARRDALAPPPPDVGSIPPPPSPPQ